MDNPVVVSALIFGALLLLMAGGMWIAIAMGVVGTAILFFWVGGDWISSIGNVQFNELNTFIFTAVPLFIFMGELILRSGMGEKLHAGANAWVGFLPGGLLLTNIASCSIFAAISGSSMATAATIGTVAFPEQEKRGYNRRLVLGSLVAGGTLGILIPPSIVMILYGAWVGASVGKLFMAGVFPGLLMSGLFMVYILGACIRRPELAPERSKLSLRAMAASGLYTWPVLVLILAVLGSIYLGVATPTEAAALGAFGGFVACILYRKFTWQVFKEAALGTVKVTSWVMLIVIGAKILSMGLAFLKVPGQLTFWVASLPVHRLTVLGIIALLYIVLGMFMEAISMMMLTLSVVHPIIIALGFDSIWFGVMMVIFVEMAQITPPVGVNLYVLHGITGRKYLSDIIIGSIPFVLCQVVVMVIITAFPSIATWLPGQMIKTF